MLDFVCLGFSLVFFWSTFVVLFGLLSKPKVYRKSTRRLKFAVLICARNEARVIALPVRSIALCKYPREDVDVIVLADNCTDDTAETARRAGATVWEKTTPSRGKGDVLAWGVDKVLASGKYDAIAVFDADNIVSAQWFEAVNDALLDGETVVTGCRHASNYAKNLISGWYAIYWGVMNELSNRVRTNLGLSGKLTGTGFACLVSAFGPEGWKTSTLVEDVEFTVQTNLAGRRVAYVPDAEYADEQPEDMRYMWRQLSRWSTGGWQVVVRYFGVWLRTFVRHPSCRLFDSFFAILTGMSVAFILLFNVLAFAYRLYSDDFANRSATMFFMGILGFVGVMGWFTAIAAVALSRHKRRPGALAILTFPFFSFVQSCSLLYTLVRPSRKWKPIPHGLEEPEPEMEATA